VCLWRAATNHRLCSAYRFFPKLLPEQELTGPRRRDAVTAFRWHLGPLQTVPKMWLVRVTVTIECARRTAKPANRMLQQHQQLQRVSLCIDRRKLLPMHQPQNCVTSGNACAAMARGQTRDPCFQRAGWEGNRIITERRHDWGIRNIHHNHAAVNHVGHEDSRDKIWMICSRYGGCLVARHEKMRACFRFTWSTLCHYHRASSLFSQGWNRTMCTVRQNQARSPNRARYKENMDQ
jgi:hypothetical protein